MRRNALLFVVLGVALAAMPVAAADATNETVEATGHQFDRTRIAVKPNVDTVTWKSLDTTELHNVQFDDNSFLPYPTDPAYGPWTSPPRTFASPPSPGRHAFYCREHGGPGGVGMSGVVYVNAQANLPPFVAFTISPNPVDSGQATSFDALGSTDSDGIAKYEWDFGDGTTETDTTPTTSHTYTGPASRTVKLKVTDKAVPAQSEERSYPVEVNAPPSTPPPPTPGPSVTPPGLGPPASLADTTGPAVNDYGATNRTFQAGKASTPTSGKSAKKKAATGTTFKYKLSEAATVKIDLQQLLPGRKKGKACVKPTAKLKKAKKCILAVSRGTLTRASHVGANSVAFSGRVGSRALKPGSYQAVLTATDAARNVSARKTLSFKIVRR